MRFLLKAFVVMLLFGVICSGISAGTLWAAANWLQQQLLQDTPFDLPQPTPQDIDVEAIKQQLRQAETISLSAADIEAIMLQQNTDEVYGIDIEITEENSLQLRYTLLVEEESETHYLNANIILQAEESDSSEQQLTIQKFSIGELEISGLMKEYLKTTEQPNDDLRDILLSLLDLDETFISNESFIDVASVNIQDQRLHIRFANEKPTPDDQSPVLPDASNQDENLPNNDNQTEKSQ